MRIYVQKTNELNVCLLPSFVVDEESKNSILLAKYKVKTKSDGGLIQLDFSKIEISDEVYFINLNKEWTEENTAQLTYAYFLAKKISFLKEENIPEFYKDLIKERAEPYEL